MSGRSELAWVCGSACWTQGACCCAPGHASQASAVSKKDEGVDATGLPEKDIEWVVLQAGVSRAVAIQALHNNEGDLVSAIMELAEPTSWR